MKRVLACLTLLGLLGGPVFAEDVVWTSATGVTVSGNNLTKTAPNGSGNAGAISTVQLDWGPAYVEFTASETTTYRLCGLSQGDSNQLESDIDFAIYLYLSTAYVYQSGSQVFTIGTYVTGDKFRIEAEPGAVRYRKNGALVYTSAIPPKFPLLVDTSLWSNGATINNVVIGTSVFSRTTNVTVAGATITKTGSSGWNAGAISAARLETGDGYVDFTATETNTNRALGLSRGDGGTSLGDIDFAVQLKADGTFDVIEAGTSRGSFGSYAASDVFRVETLGGTVRYKRNGTTFYTSAGIPTYPLVVDTALDTVAATLTDIKFVTMLWANATSVSVSGGTLTKTGSAGWNAGATSTASFTGDGWIEFTANETTTDRVAGLSNGDSNQTDADVDFGIWLKSDGTVAILEAGANRGAFGTYAVADRFRVEVADGAVKYRKNGVVFYSSLVAPTYPLLVDTSLDEVGATVGDVAMGQLVWKSDAGLKVNGVSLQKTNASGWTSGAVTTATITGDGSVEFVASETNTYRILGLSNGNPGLTETEIDFGIYLYTTTAYVYENNVNRYSFGAYALGDRFTIEVTSNVVRYYKNGVLGYTSTVTPTYPLLVDTALWSANAMLINVTLGGPATPTVATPTFSPAGGTYTSAQTVTILCATSGAEIRYTTDGSEPTTSSTLYTGALSVGTTTTVKARAWKAAYDPSAVGSATYTMNFGTAPPPGLSPAAATYTSSVSVTLSSTLTGATLRYTTDGSEPTSTSNAYTAPIVVTTTTTLKAKTFHPDYTASGTVSATYTIEVAQPTFTPDGGTHAAGTTVTVATATAGATIRYTLNGAEPTTSDPVIASGGTLAVGNYTLKAKAWKTGCSTSSTKSATYVMTGVLTQGAFASSRFLSLALKYDGTVWAWGNGPLGDGTSGISSIPRRVAGLTGVMGIAVGPSFGVAVRQDGTVWTWGSDANGTLGNGAATGDVLMPTAIGLTGVTAVAAGETHLLARKSDGTVVSWGLNTNGQLGDGTTTLRTSPVPIPELSGVAAVAAGARHSVALLSDGTVRAWGANGFSQVGDGTTTDRLTPVRVDGLSSITAIASGWYHTLALRDDATVWAWGDNSSFGLGDGTRAVRTTPVRPLIEGATAIAVGSIYSMALKADGSLWTWGTGTSGELGNGATTADAKAPTQVSGVSGLVVLGSSQSGNPRALTSDRRVLSWGRNLFGESSVGDGTAIARRVVTEISGPDFEWKVGTPTFTISTVARGAFETISAPSTVTFGVATAGATIRYTTNGADPAETDTAIAAGGTLAVDSTMTLKARAFKAGMPASNIDGVMFALKPATPTFSPNPAVIYTTAPQNVTIACTTSSVTIRYTTDGSEPTASSTAYTAAIPISSQTTFKAKAFRSGWTASDTATATYSFNLGTSTTPTIGPAAGTYTDSVSVTLSAPAGCSIRYTTNGSDPTTGSALYASPFAMTANGTVKARAWCVNYAQSAVASAAYTVQAHAPLLSPAGGTYSYGQNVMITSDVEGGTMRYTLGGADPTVNDPIIASGTTLSLVADSTIKARVFKTGLADGLVASGIYTITGTGISPGSVDAGSEFSFAVRPDGSLWAWGRNASGNLGDGSNTLAPTPKPVTGFGTLTAIAGGASHSLALRTDGTVYAAGENGNGQLGQGNWLPYTNPVQVLNLSNVTAVAAGYNHGLAVSNGAVWAWGQNGKGQLGDNSTANRSTPVPSQGLTSGVIEVAAGAEHSLALKSNGEVWAWGADTYGQLGNDAAQVTSLLPVQVSGITTAVAVAAGYDHSLALLADGTVRAWGRNWYGQLGDGGNTTSPTPVTVAGLAGVRAIGATNFTSVAARTDGSVTTWGYNFSGELGVTGPNSNRPLFVPGPTGIVALAGGAIHMLALGRDGTLWAWGNNTYSQIGNGATGPLVSPVKISGPALDWAVPMPTMSVVSGTYTAEQTVTLGGATTGALIHYTTNGLDPAQTDPSVSPGGTVTITQSATLKAKAFKSGMPPSDVAAAIYTLRVPTPAFSVAGGTYAADFTVAISTPGVTGATIRYAIDAYATESSPTYTAPITVDRTMAVRVKAWRTGWTESAEAWTYYVMKVATPALSPVAGSYSSAQTVMVSTTTPAATLRYTTDGREPGDGTQPIASGGTVLVDKSGTLTVRGYRTGWTPSDVVWGSYSISLGTLAAPSITPPAGTYASVQTVALSGPTGAALRYTTDGSEPNFTSRLYTGPIPVDATMTVKAKAFKEDHTPSATTSSAYTITLSNTVEPVAFNPPAGAYTTTRTATLTTATAGATIHYTTNGLDPTTSDPSVASGGNVTVDRHLALKARAVKAGMTASPIRAAVYQISGAIGAGGSHACVVKAEATVWCFGANDLGQLGDGTTTNRTTPVQVTGLTDVVQVMPAGHAHSLAVKADGTVRSWGYNYQGMLGDGTTTQRLTPVQVSSLTEVTAVAAGIYHSLGLKSDGTVWAWGDNGSGQLGNGTTTDSLTPVQVSGLTDVVAIAAGWYHSAALKRDGTVWTWGRNDAMQLGDGTTTDRNAPVQVPGLTGAVAIAAGGYHTRALKTDGAVTGSMWVWGANTATALGTGSTSALTVVATPTRVLTNVAAMASGGEVGLALAQDGRQRSLLGVGSHFGNTIVFPGSDGISVLPWTTPGWLTLTKGPFVAVAASSYGIRMALKWDTSLFVWGSYPAANGFVLGNGGASGDDPDGDGLTTAEEWSLGTDPWTADTNGDGISDGEAVATGRSATNLDMDGDGVLNAAERNNGTDPFRSDTDNDTVADATDCFPLDPARTTCPAPTPGDTTPPTITLTEPTNAVLIP